MPNAAWVRRDQPLQRPMIRPVGEADPPLGLVEAETPAIDAFAADAARYRAQAGAGAHRVGVDVGRQAVEQGGIELEGLAVGVDIGAREARPQQRSSDAWGGAEQLVDLAILETAQLLDRNPQLAEQALRIDPATVRRGDHQRQRAGIRMEHLDRRTMLRRHRRRQAPVMSGERGNDTTRSLRGQADVWSNAGGIEAVEICGFSP